MGVVHEVKIIRALFAGEFQARAIRRAIGFHLVVHMRIAEGKYRLDQQPGRRQRRQRQAQMAIALQRG